MVTVLVFPPVLPYFPSSPVTQAATVVSRAKVCYRAELGGRQVDLARLGDESWALGRRRGGRAWKQRKYQRGCGWGGEASIFGGL